MQENNSGRNKGGSFLIIFIVILVLGFIGHTAQEKLKEQNKPTNPLATITVPTISASVNWEKIESELNETQSFPFSYGGYDASHYINKWANLNVVVPNGYRIGTEQINVANGTPFAMIDNQHHALVVRITDSNGYPADEITEELASNLESRGYSSIGRTSTFIHGDLYEVSSFQTTENGMIIYSNIYLRVLDDHVILVQTMAPDVASLQDMEKTFIS